MFQIRHMANGSGTQQNWLTDNRVCLVLLRCYSLLFFLSNPIKSDAIMTRTLGSHELWCIVDYTGTSIKMQLCQLDPLMVYQLYVPCRVIKLMQDLSSEICTQEYFLFFKIHINKQYSLLCPLYCTDLYVSIRPIVLEGCSQITIHWIIHVIKVNWAQWRQTCGLNWYCWKFNATFLWG